MSRRQQSLNNLFDDSNNLRSQTRVLIDSWQDDLYRDFESIYASMCTRHDSNPTLTQVDLWKRQLDQISVALEAAEAQARLDETAPAVADAADDTFCFSRQLSPGASSTYGKLTVTPCTPQQPLVDFGEPSRADSCNTNQSFQNGPALVDEMTLSDLEDEISSSLMATREARASYRAQRGNKVELVDQEPPAPGRYTN